MMLTEMPLVYAGSGFPWGLLIIGGILYLLWRNGFFEGRGFGNRGYGPRYGPGQGGGPGFRGPREYFDEWHRESHQAVHQAHAPAQPAEPQAPVTPAAPAAAEGGNGDQAR